MRAWGEWPSVRGECVNFACLGEGCSEGEVDKIGVMGVSCAMTGGFAGSGRVIEGTVVGVPKGVTGAEEAEVEGVEAGVVEVELECAGDVGGRGIVCEDPKVGGEAFETLRVGANSASNGVGDVMSCAVAELDEAERVMEVVVGKEGELPDKIWFCNFFCSSCSCNSCSCVCCWCSCRIRSCNTV